MGIYYHLSRVTVYKEKWFKPKLEARLKENFRKDWVLRDSLATYSAEGWVWESTQDGEGKYEEEVLMKYLLKTLVETMLGWLQKRRPGEDGQVLEGLRGKFQSATINSCHFSTHHPPLSSSAAVATPG